MSSELLGWVVYGLVLLLVFRGVVRMALKRAERQLAAVDAEAKRRIRVAEQRALAGVRPELRPVVEAAMRQAEDEALWLQELIMPPSPITVRGLVASARTVRRVQRLQRADVRL